MRTNNLCILITVILFDVITIIFRFNRIYVACAYFLYFAYPFSTTPRRYNNNRGIVWVQRPGVQVSFPTLLLCQMVRIKYWNMYSVLKLLLMSKMMPRHLATWTLFGYTKRFNRYISYFQTLLISCIIYVYHYTGIFHTSVKNTYTYKYL